jgi:hypothetical protein
MQGKKYPRNACYKQCSLSPFFLALGLYECWQLTREARYLTQGERCVDEMLMFQSSFQPDYMPITVVGGFGVMNLYTTLSYTVIVGLCYAFISGGIFVVNYSSILLFLAGLGLTYALNRYVYRAITKEVSLGKTVASSVRNGYNKTSLGMVDVYAVALLSALALLIGAAGFTTMACQAIVCIVAGAFCNLVLGRAINVLLLSASKDKYKYFRLVREDDDDE